MAIILLKSGEKTYVSGTGRATTSDIERAENIYSDLSKMLNDYEQDALKEGYLLADGTKKDALKIWYEIGKILNIIAAKYNILGTSDEPYYWQSIYDHIPPLFQKLQPPQSATGNRNHFKRCAYMAGKGVWTFVRGVGNWSTWRDLLDNIKLQEDRRVFDWVVNSLHSSGLGHKEVRPFIHEVRRSIRNKDTSVLTDQELSAKLEPLRSLLEKKQAH